MTKEEKQHAQIFIQKWSCETDGQNFIPKHIAFELLEKLEQGFWKNPPAPQQFDEPRIYNVGEEK